jgi:branched-chain amino acid transport system ATP-binding protein
MSGSEFQPNGTHASADPALAVTNLGARYGKRIVLTDVNLTLAKGEIVAVLGHNGAGKTTLLQGIMGMVRERSGTVTSFGRTISNQPYYKNVAASISIMPAESPVFRTLSVETDLRLGAYSTMPTDLDDRLEQVYGMFPRLRERRTQHAGTLSGGEQRMLTIGMAVINRPRIILLDEPSIGLAPATAERILAEIRQLVMTSGTSVLLVDQNVRGALRVCSRVYYLRMGKIILEESAEAARARPHYWDLF